ncbi:restriction endonuclease subunit S [Streptomyces sp. SAS_272]|uniref:restriction endonuclease subunit S n=1 Tax=Streptomyces sp. SAS_272 TaxID=3412747 RepID=UPI00403D1B3B
MSDWTRTTVGDVVTLQRGFDITKAQQNPGEVPVVSSGGISSYHDVAMVKGPGVVMGRKGTLGKVFYLDHDYWPHDTTLWVKDFKGNDPRFVYFFLGTLNFLSMDVGSSNPTLNRNHVHPVPVNWPSLREQQGIAAVLGALDDKIAVNDRIAATTVELADAQFIRAVSGLEVGQETFGSVASVSGGGTPSTTVDEYWGGEVYWTTPSDVTALPSPYLFETNRRITELGLENCASQLYPPQSIFMTSRATIGAFALPQVPAAVNQGFIVVLPPNEGMRWWLLHEMRSRVDEMISLANGSTFLELSRKNFKAMQIRLPDTVQVEEFARTVAPLHAAAAQATQENRALAALRDTLLPQLMSGRLRVKDAEKIVEDHA